MASRRREQSPTAERRFWLVKQEPSDYPWTQLVADGVTAWTGVRNFQARNHLRAMQAGELVLYYHTGETREVVGVARVARAAYPDPTATEGEWVAVDLAPVEALRRPVGLASIKGDPALKDLALLRQSRLSVTPLGAREFARLLELGGLGRSGSQPEERGSVRRTSRSDGSPPQSSPTRRRAAAGPLGTQPRSSP